MCRSGKISIDKIVTIRSSVLPLYVIIQQDGRVTAMDEVSEDAYDFLTTQMVGNKIAFRSYHGHYLSAAGDTICTKRYCSADELFEIVMKDHQYTFRSRSGKFLSMLETDPFVALRDECDETELFQLFSLMMQNINVGQQLEALEKTGSVMLDALLDDEELDKLNKALALQQSTCVGHEATTTELLGKHTAFAQLATHPIIMQIMRRVISPSAKLSSLESCQTDADHVRKELEETTWSVVHPYKSLEFPGAVDGRMSLTAMWFLDDLHEGNSTWAWVAPPPMDGKHAPRLPQLSSSEEVGATVKGAKPLLGRRGAVWLYLGPMWTSNNVGAASFWKEYDALTRYKHLSGQKPAGGSFRSLTDDTQKAPPKPELCPTLIQATYVREYVVPQDMARAPAPLSDLSEMAQRELLKLLP